MVMRSVKEAIYRCVAEVFNGSGLYEDVKNNIQVEYDITDGDFENLVVQLIKEGRLVRSPSGDWLETDGDPYNE